MSEMTPCNYCTFQFMKERRRRQHKGKKVQLRTTLGWKDMEGWHIVEEKIGDGEWKDTGARFMAITNHCVC